MTEMAVVEDVLQDLSVDPKKLWSFVARFYAKKYNRMLAAFVKAASAAAKISESDLANMRAIAAKSKMAADEAYEISKDIPSAASGFSNYVVIDDGSKHGLIKRKEEVIADLSDRFSKKIEGVRDQINSDEIRSIRTAARIYPAYSHSLEALNRAASWSLKRDTIYVKGKTTEAVKYISANISDERFATYQGIADDIDLFALNMMTSCAMMSIAGMPQRGTVFNSGAPRRITLTSGIQAT